MPAFATNTSSLPNLLKCLQEETSPSQSARHAQFQQQQHRMIGPVQFIPGFLCQGDAGEVYFKLERAMDAWHLAGVFNIFK
jgi:hypothetical protein